MERCSNCNREIGKLETPQLWGEDVVCSRCRDLLEEDMAREAVAFRGPPEPAGLNYESSPRRSAVINPTYIGPPPRENETASVLKVLAWMCIILGLLVGLCAFWPALLLAIFGAVLLALPSR